MVSNTVSIEGRSFALSRLDKVLWPQDGYTKGELINYYVEVAPYIIPHLQGRPMVFTRYPDGIEKQSFYQKNAPQSLPQWIKTYPYYSPDSQRDINFILVEESATLAWLANQACIEMHPWLSCATSVDYPDFAVFDLDPSPGNTFEQIRVIALLTRQILSELGLRSYIKTSGSEGLHVYLPLENKYSYEEVRDFGRSVAQIICTMQPDIATVERTVKKRGAKIYVDYMQNVKGKTLCSAYSVRPRTGATVSAPLDWDEVNSIKPSNFTIKTVLPRLQKVGDLFAPVLSDRQSLETAISQLGLKTEGK
jgi:bifunctional non-homologous end joining protein LigD